MKKIALIFFVLLGITLSAQVTVKETKVFSFHKRHDALVTFLGDEGFVIHGKAVENKDDQRWRITKISSALVKGQELDFKIPENFFYKTEYLTEDKKQLYLMFIDKKFSVFFVRYEVSSNTITSIQGQFPDKYKYIDEYDYDYLKYQYRYLSPIVKKTLVATDNSIFVSGRIKDESVVVKFDFNTGKSLLLNLPVLDKNVAIRDLDFFKEHNLLVVYRSATDKPSSESYQILFFDENGNKLEGDNNLLKGESEKVLLNANIFWIGKDNFLVSGGFSADKGFLANGFYISEFQNLKQKSIKYFLFEKLDKFLDYLNDKAEARVSKRVEKASEKGKSIVERNMFCHQLYRFGENYIFIGELFKPEIETIRTGSGSTQTSEKVFKGFEYSHATIVCLNNKLEKIWDKCFPLEDAEYLNIVSNQILVNPNDLQKPVFYFPLVEIRNNIFEQRITSFSISSDLVTKYEKAVGFSVQDKYYCSGNRFFVIDVTNPGALSNQESKVEITEIKSE